MTNFDETGREFRYALRNNPTDNLSEDDVLEVVASWTDGSDYPAFAWLLKLADGEYAAAIGSHDYTGWDCQSVLEVTVWSNEADAIRFGLGVNERENLGLLLPEEK